MSKSDRDHARYEELAAGYVLHALEPEDESVLLAHLAYCDDCSATVQAWHATAAQLAHAADQAVPSPMLRERLLDAIGHEAVDEPVTVSGTPRSDVRSLADHRTSRRHGATSRHGTVQVSTRVLASAAVLTGLIAGGVVFDRARVDGNAAKSSLAATQQVIDAIANHNARVIDLGSAGSVSGKAVVVGRQVWLVANGLPKNDKATSIYVMWSRGASNRMVAITSFDVAKPSSPTVVKVTNLPDGVDAKVFAVSLEPGRTPPSAPSRAVLGPNTA